MRRYHHIGIPTTVRRDGETYLPRFKMHVIGYDTNPYGIEWVRFEPDSPLPDLVRTVAHDDCVALDSSARRTARARLRARFGARLVLAALAPARFTTR